MPAWIQAVGSIVAILASLGIIAYDHQKQRDAAQSQENAELANLVLATYMLGLSTNNVISTLQNNAAGKGYVTNSTLEYCISQIGRVIEQNAHLPHWKMDLKAATTWSFTYRCATSFEAALRLVKADEADVEYAVVSGIKEMMFQWLSGVIEAQNECARRYKELVGKEIPADL